jgi:hypothetical protein
MQRLEDHCIHRKGTLPKSIMVDTNCVGMLVPQQSLAYNDVFDEVLQFFQSDLEGILGFVSIQMAYRNVF